MTHKSSIAALLALLTVCCSFLQDDVKQPTQEDVKLLKREITKLKGEAKRLKEQLEVAEHNGFYWPGTKDFKSPLALLKDLPKNLAVKRNKTWSKFDLPEVNEHLNRSRGQIYAARHKLKSLTIRESDQRDVFDVTVSFWDRSFSYEGRKFKTRYHISALYKYRCSAETVKKLRKINLQKPVAVSARISHVSINGSYFELRLKELTLNRIELP